MEHKIHNRFISYIIHVTPTSYYYYYYYYYYYA